MSRAFIPVALIATLLLPACKTVTRTSFEVSRNPTPIIGYDPARDLGPLFHEAQVAQLFGDSKTLVDARPLEAPAALATRYTTERTAVGFSLKAFVDRWFTQPLPAASPAGSATSTGMEQHIRDLWPLLTRAADAPDPRSSLIPLPKPYVVPGGRFREVYYWDSYFTMLGLVESKTRISSATCSTTSRT